SADFAKDTPCFGRRGPVTVRPRFSAAARPISRFELFLWGSSKDVCPTESAMASGPGLSCRTGFASFRRASLVQADSVSACRGEHRQKLRVDPRERPLDGHGRLFYGVLSREGRPSTRPGATRRIRSGGIHLPP